MNPMLRKVLGEGSSNKSLFPDNARDMDATNDIVGKPLRPIVKVVQEPSRPSGDKEKYLTPYAALTAPDCTPDSLKPIDSSRVPGSTGPERFTASDLENTQEVPETGLGSQHPSMKAMDVLLGRRRTGNPARTPAEFQEAGNVQTEAQAAAMVASLNEDAGASAKVAAQSAILSAQDGGAMPEPAPPSDGRNVLSAFRRFVG